MLVNKKIIIEKKDNASMVAWEKIFFMFYNTNKSYNTMADIATATTQYYNLSNAMTEGTVSKHKNVLNGIIEYKGKSYTIRKLNSIDKSGRTLDEKSYRLIQADETDLLWQEGKEKLLDNKLLTSNQLCVVSKHMYIFKLNKVIRKKKNPENSQSEDEKTSEKERLRKKIKQVKSIFSEMILPDCLFDISYFDGNIAVILNSQNPKSKERYSSYLEHFFDT